MKFKLVSSFQPSGDQPNAIQSILDSIRSGNKYHTLKGVTGSGKTFTIANIIESLQMPVLVISHNKTLAAQLYHEFKAFFPNNAVEFFVSNYDYYRPEAYIHSKNLLIDKDLIINEEIERLRLSTISSLLERQDVIVVATVSCLFGIGSPEAFKER